MAYFVQPMCVRCHAHRRTRQLADEEAMMRELGLLLAENN